MTTKMSIRELTRNSDKLLEYDYVEIVNSRTNTPRGIFIPPRYADEIKRLLEDRIMKDRQAKVAKLREFSGMLSGEIGERSIADIKGEMDD